MLHNERKIDSSEGDLPSLQLSFCVLFFSRFRAFMPNLPFPDHGVVGVVMESNNQQGEPICRGGESSSHPKEEGRHL